MDQNHFLNLLKQFEALHIRDAINSDEIEKVKSAEKGIKFEL